ncbi:hypothetical protein L1987_79571 [Smallanthus sonchifolius]|uniref:Uncharacterized protein n=1 Tax=Smallanthus sonchifolius TaxID=185202 RepID=A0ACB8ZG58_9ASTR|nr:hypothetical protein L1987_79571 [Smallanthus sonchifolius]
MLDCFEKWAGGLNTKDHELWRKIKEPNGKRVRWLDGEPEVCHPEEVIQRKKNKKQKKGANPFLSQQGVVPLERMKFHAGRVHTKDSQSKTKCRESHMSKLDPLFGDLVARKERLREIVANIVTTDVNKALVNSILGMKQFKVLKFSAKMNADGKVTIDENMVEADQGPEVLKDPQQAQAPISRTHTQATNLKEAHNSDSNEPLPKEKHNHDKPPDNDGFTLVQRRKGGQWDYGNGRQSVQGFKPNGSGYERMASNGNTRDKGNIGNFMYTRNIVNNQRA